MRVAARECIGADDGCCRERIWEITKTTSKTALPGKTFPTRTAILHTHHQEGTLTRHEMEEALRAAAADIYRCTVAITTMFEEDDLGNASFDDLRPGTGVLVESSGVHGILTAAHVLGGRDKTNRYEQDRCTIGILPLQDTRTRSSEQVYFRIRRRRCLAYGVQNEDANGPDLAYIPLTPREWALLEPDGVRAWTPHEEPDPRMPRNTKAEILLDCCLGPNRKATRRLQEEHPEARPAIAFPSIAGSGTTTSTGGRR